MTGNMSYLSEYEEIDGGYVAFGGDLKRGKITSKGKISIGKLDFKDVYFVKEPKFNLFSVSQMCDKKNSVLFTDTEYVVLSPNFKLLDESQVLLRVPRKKNMYSVDLRNIAPSGGLTCLFAKNKEMNQFCEMKSIRREFSVARTPQQNGVAERKNKTIIEAARTMLADSKLPTTFWTEAVNTACYVQNKVLVIKPHNKTPYELFLGTKVNIDVGKKTVPSLQYVLLPLLTSDSQCSKDEVVDVAGKKSTEVTRKENEVQNPAIEGGNNDQEKDIRDQEEALRKQFEQKSKRFLVAGANNDLTVLNNSSLFDDLLDDAAPVAPFECNSVAFEKGYYLADGIYPQWSSFVKSFTVANLEKNALFKRKQESVRKDIERAFGILQGRWHIILEAELGHAYDRPQPRETLVVSLAKDADANTPQQVHISLVGEDRMRISWITDDHTPPTVYYSITSGKYDHSANGTISSYDYVNYTSGQIHDVVIGPLNPSTVYYYCFAPGSTHEYSFKTPQAQFPIKFAVSGDLGQTGWTKSTLEHISQSNYDVFLLPGDLCYADTVQPLWDSFGRLVEPLASRRPWMVTQGNHDIEQTPNIRMPPFTSYNARWRMPFEESGSTSNLYYSFKVSGVYVVMLGSYADFGPDSNQYQWLESELKKVDRTKTPWLVVLIHAPWYNTNYAHQGEIQSVGMMESMEGLLYKARVDVVLAGHVHAYERFHRVYHQQMDNCGPVHITIGDGGNLHGLVTTYKQPQATISAFREASFGHGELEIVNASYAKWSWHRNDDDESVQADMVLIKSLASDPSCQGALSHARDLKFESPYGGILLASTSNNQDDEGLRDTIAILMREEMEKIRPEFSVGAMTNQGGTMVRSQDGYPMQYMQFSSVTKIELPRFGGEDVIVRKKIRPPVLSAARVSNYSPGGHIASPKPLSLPTLNSNWRNRPQRKQLTQKELKEKRAKNLCFYYDQKYSLGHKCPSQMFCLEVIVDKESVDDENEILLNCLEEKSCYKEQEFNIWNAFEENTRYLGSFGEETDKITNQHQDSLRFKVSEPRDGITIHTRRRHTSSSDDVTTSLDGVSPHRLNSNLEDFTL
uniref:Purple acid phosphatase n=1 Tax=Tanacetum cinerariifolium TaxID=118510 RepID=A0A6L2L2K1_TANCI|nr:probable purple acid phosphatase 20 [Tanacetum cinerariifolium]